MAIWELIHCLNLLLACPALHCVVEIDAELQESGTGVFDIFPFHVVATSGY